MNILYVNNIFSILILIFGFGQSYCAASTARKFVKKEKIDSFANIMQKLSKFSNTSKAAFNNVKIKLDACGKQSYKQFIAGYAVGAAYYGAIAYKNDQVAVEHFANFKNKFALSGVATYLGIRGIGWLFKKKDHLEDNEDDSSLDSDNSEYAQDDNENSDLQYVVHPLVKVAAFITGFYAGYRSLQIGVKYKFPYVASVIAPTPLSMNKSVASEALTTLLTVKIANGIIDGSATMTDAELLKKSAAYLLQCGEIKW